MSDAPTQDSGSNYWKQESIKQERKARRYRDQLQELERTLTSTLGVRTLDEALSQVRELSEATREWPSLMDELEELRGKKDSLEKDPQIAELKKQLASRDRRDEWSQELKDQLNDGVPIEDVWAKAGYVPGAEPVGEAIKELVGKAREAAPYMFKPPAGAGEAADAAKAGAGVGAGAPAKPSAVGGGMGAPDRTSGRVTYSKADTQAPDWQKQRPALVEALKQGTAVLIEN